MTHTTAPNSRCSRRGGRKRMESVCCCNSGRSHHTVRCSRKCVSGAGGKGADKCCWMGRTRADGWLGGESSVPVPYSAEPRLGADGLQRPLVPRSRFQWQGKGNDFQLKKRKKYGKKKNLF